MSDEAVAPKVARHASEEEARLLAGAVEFAPDGLALLRPTAEPTGPEFSFVNEALCRMYGVRREEILDQNLAALRIIDRHQAIADDMLGHVFEGESFNAEVTARRKDGTEFEIDLQLVP